MLPDLSPLERDYQILTELHRSDESHTFLARHLGLNRDVTITVVQGPNAAALKSYDEDAARLIALRHPHVIPVIEGRWLGDHEYAIVHARVRGSTLDQLVSAIGGMPSARVAAALEQTYSALAWARENGIANRHVTPDELIFQQGSGRVLLALTPESGVMNVERATTPARGTAGASNRCMDAHTIGELAFMMLTGQRVEDAGTQALGLLRPNLPAALVASTETLLRCNATGVIPDVGAYIAQFGPVAAMATPVSATPVASTAAVPAAAMSTAAMPEREIAVPLATRADTAVVASAPRRGMSFGARFATALVVLIVLGAAAMLIVNHREKPDRHASTETSMSSDTGAEAAGEIALRARQSDSALAAQVPERPRISPPAGASPVPVVTPASTPTPTSPKKDTPLVMTPPPQEIQVVPAPETRRHEPPRPTKPALVMPDSAALPRPDSARPGDVCDSPASADQRRCLMDAVEHNDATLNDVYQRLITGLRRQASVQPDDPDPASVETLRNAQRRWLEARDEQCRAVGSGALFARDRAACFANQSDKRMRELQQMLDSIPPS